MKFSDVEDSNRNKGKTKQSRGALGPWNKNLIATGLPGPRNKKVLKNTGSIVTEEDEPKTSVGGVSLQQECRRLQGMTAESSSTAGSKQVSNTISDNQIISRNKSIIKSDLVEDAKKTWALRKQLGMISSEEDTTAIEKLVEMEKRDRVQCKKGGQSKGGQRGKEKVLCE